MPLSCSLERPAESGREFTSERASHSVVSLTLAASVALGFPPSRARAPVSCPSGPVAAGSLVAPASSDIDRVTIAQPIRGRSPTQLTTANRDRTFVTRRQVATFTPNTNDGDFCSVGRLSFELFGLSELSFELCGLRPHQREKPSHRGLGFSSRGP